MKKQEYQFKTTLNLLGKEKDATCCYTIGDGGNVIPYSVRIGGLLYSVDSWRDQLKKEASEDYQENHKGVAV